MTALSPLPPQPKDTPWPTHEWPSGELSRSADRARLAQLLERAFGDMPPDDLAETHALVLVQHGRLLLERYWKGYSAASRFLSHSIAKSVTHALVGILVMDGKLDIHAPADVPEWQSPADPRRPITLDLLLRMSSGLEFVEVYGSDRPSDVIGMLWGAGTDDMAHYAASLPLEYPPGTFWSYSSGTSNIIARCVARAAGIGSAREYKAFMRARLFDPLGMASARPQFDRSGTFVGSTFCPASARDFARFGLLYLRDGVWADKRLLPNGWVDYARTPTWQQPTDKGRYGAHWWLDLVVPGSFSANGSEGQMIVVIPEKDMVVVRHGATPMEKWKNIYCWIAAIVDCL